MEFQATLFDTSPAEPSLGRLGTAVERTALAHGAWVDVRRNWVAGADDVLATLLTAVPWRAERRQMYDRLVAVPRLVHTYGVGEDLPHPLLTAAREALSAHYAPELDEPFVTAGCCYYRDGRDSVAWHGDTIGRGRTRDTMVAIVSLGDPRRLTLRPRREAAAASTTGSHRDPAAEPQGRDEHRPRREAAAASTTLAFTLGHGDLLVMGGSCQRTWEHAVPKTAHAGPRVSVQFRPLNVF